MRKTSWKKAYAYVIGLNRYQHLATLSYCEKDARMFAETISEVIPDIKSTLFDGTSFTIEKFKNVLKEIGSLNEKDESSVLFFYYAGHGFSYDGKDYITSYDTNNCDVKTMANSSISTADLIDAASKSGVNNVVMIFDACRNVFVRGVTTSVFGNLTAEISRRKGTISFFSCSQGEYSNELGGDISHGIYTYSLIQALRQKCRNCSTPVAINKSVIETVRKLVKENNLSAQTPFTTVGPIEKGNLDIISGNEISYENKKKPLCILIAGSTHAGKSSIGSYLATQYNENDFMHYEMSALAYQHYENSQKNGSFCGTIDDFLEYELCAKNENKDILARDLLEKYDGCKNIVISGPRFVEEIESLVANSKWNVIPLYIHSSSSIRLDRFLALQKDQSLTKGPLEITHKSFIRKDMRQLGWGLAKIATMGNFEMIMNNHEIVEFQSEVKKYTDSAIARLYLDLGKQ